MHVLRDFIKYFVQSDEKGPIIAFIFFATMVVCNFIMALIGWFF